MSPAPHHGAPVDWLIVGLGNPGSRYAGTPHNVGFAVVERLRERWALSSPKTKYRGLLSEGRVSLGPRPNDGTPLAAQVALLRPQTYMNDSGRSVGPARGALAVEVDRIAVVHDEIDLPFGEIRVRQGGGLAGHNGLKSIRSALGSADFHRVRIGVGRPPTTDPERVAAYVLGKIAQSRTEVDALLDRAVDAVTGLLARTDA